MNAASAVSLSLMSQATDLAENQRDAVALETLKKEAAKISGEEGSKKAEELSQLREVAQDFESMFLHMMFKQMRATLPKNDFFGNSRAEEIFTDMRDAEVSKDLAKAGGMGLADLLVEQLRSKI